LWSLLLHFVTVNLPGNVAININTFNNYPVSAFAARIKIFKGCITVFIRRDIRVPVYG